MNYIEDSDLNDGVISDSNDSKYIDTDIGTEEYIDIDEIDSDHRQKCEGTRQGRSSRSSEQLRSHISKI
jgi:hypothetical protein